MGFVYFISGAMLIPLGIFATVDPEEYIYLQSFFRFRSVEPTDWYVTFTRVCGVLCTIAGIAMVVFAFIV